MIQMIADSWRDLGLTPSILLHFSLPARRLPEMLGVGLAGTVANRADNIVSILWIKSIRQESLFLSV